LRNGHWRRAPWQLRARPGAQCSVPIGCADDRRRIARKRCASFLTLVANRPAARRPRSSPRPSPRREAALRDAGTEAPLPKLIFGRRWPWKLELRGRCREAGASRPERWRDTRGRAPPCPSELGCDGLAEIRERHLGIDQLQGQIGEPGIGPQSPMLQHITHHAGLAHAPMATDQQQIALARLGPDGADLIEDRFAPDQSVRRDRRTDDIGARDRLAGLQGAHVGCDALG
jgi:hypothetical protein